MPNLNYKKIQIGPDQEAAIQDVIVLHGIGADENSLIPFIEHLNIPGHYFFIQAPFTYGASGFAFFEVNFTSSGPAHNKEQARVSIEMLHQWIVEHKANGVLKSSDKLCVMGFSQGAIMSYALALAHPESVDKVIGLNGRVLKEIEAQRPMVDKKIAIYAFYGRHDEIQPLHFAHEARERLSLDWVELEYREGDCGHEITEESVQFVASALRA